MLFSAVCMVLVSCSGDSANTENLRTLTVTPPVNGKITGRGIDCGSGTSGDCTEVFDEGASVVLTAIADSGYRLGEWIGCTSVTSSCTLAMSVNKTVTVPVVEYPNERVDLFIAHEGGAIDGHTYTDCLEALNLSYEKGARMFELDIIKTADNVFVAAHDWSWFGEISGNLSVSDSNPMTWQEFSVQKIWDKYTPLDIYAINKWFGDHPDSILVTDKINTPKEFSEAFLYKERLIMELFTWGAVQEAVDSGIKAMPTSELVFGRSDIEAKLAALDVKYIAISRRQIDANKDLLRRLKNNGIKAYAFLLDSEHDENYVFKNEMEWLAGMYADDLGLILNPP